MARIPIWASIDPRPAYRRMREEQARAMESMRTKRLLEAYASQKRGAKGTA